MTLHPPKAAVTKYNLFCALLGEARRPTATAECIDSARRAVADRRDWLAGKQAKKYSKGRVKEILALEDIYNELAARMGECRG
jgi:hypothetical protein